jgi:hypothetical protein
MTLFFISSLFGLVAVATFGIGFAIGYNVAKHPGKVEQQVKDVVEQIRK